ncbi:YkvA family protein [Candidatus Undinarchaeota archaeon]
MKKANKKEIAETLKNKTNFCDILKENTKNYNGDYSEVIQNMPEIYALLCDLLRSKNISVKTRNRICATIAYFILPKDVFPEEVFGTKGYLDDLLLSLHILKEVEVEYEFEELLEYWDGEPKLLKKLITEDYDELYAKFNYIFKDILEYVGIKKN